MAELGMVRTTIFERLGMDTVTLGLPANATLFSYLLPTFNTWVMQLGSNYLQGSRDGLGVILQQLQEWNSESFSVLAGTFLRWVVNQPIFSLAPLKPVNPAYIVEGAPYYFGGGGRLLFSMDGAHQSSRMGAAMIGYLTGYFLGDSILAVLHFFNHHSYLAGWVHHIAYTGVAYSLAKNHTLSIFSICVGTLEPSTIFLALGHMFPAARCDLVFGTTFFVLRIVLCALFLHEFAFNHPRNTGGATQILSACLTLHSYWFVLFVQGVVRRAKRASKEKAKAKTKKLVQDQEQNEMPQRVEITTGVSRSVVQLRFRPNKDTKCQSH
ncbi:hypothetical protein BGZ92_011215 [Podila epicladia]|nr:hypothetical protein BGZ92_011215 [Podila epicladia]